MCLSKLFGGTKPKSPSDWLREDAMSYNEDTGILTVDLNKMNVQLEMPPRLWYPPIPDTGSMLPVFGAGNNNLLIWGRTPNDQKALLDFAKAGDIAVYRTDRFYAIHRIKKKIVGTVRKWIFRGDNNTVDDPDAASDEQLQWVSLGTLY
mgnify:CR=1 FL=1